MVARVAAAQATLDAFAGKPLIWGEADCLRLVCHTLIGLGYQLAERLAHASYGDARGARKAIKRAGYADTPDIMDGLGLSRLPGPASALAGDILAFEGSGPDAMTPLGITLSNGRCLAFAETAPGAAPVCVIGARHVARATIAWRPECRI